MLPETIDLSFSEDGVAAATTKSFIKRAHEINRAEYRNLTTVNDPALPAHGFMVRITDPKATKDFYGTRRVNISLRRERLIPVPSGSTEVKHVAVYKIEASIPVGIEAAEIEGDVAWIRAYINSDVFKRSVKTLET